MLLDVHGLCSGYARIPVLHGIDFSVAKGEIVGILGHNGMGKTTLLRTLMGFNPTTSGSIRLNDREIRALETDRRVASGLGYVPQGRQLFHDLTVAENLAMGAIRRGGAATEIVAGVRKRFPRLEKLWGRRGGSLSGGEQQLVALARCLCGEPTIMLLDEPTEGIQPSIIDEMLETLRAINRKSGITIVVVEQNLDFIADLASRVLVLERGRIRHEISIDDARDPARLAAHMFAATAS